MALDATVGGPNANSYLTVARADVLAADHPYSSPYTALTTDLIKGTYLILASRTLNYRTCFLGTPTNEDQALKFPRTGLLNSNGLPLDPLTIPLEIELATFELTLSLIESNVTVESAVAVLGLNRIKAGPIDLGFNDTVTMRTIPEHVRLLLVPSWLCPEPTASIYFKNLVG